MLSSIRGNYQQTEIHNIEHKSKIGLNFHYNMLIDKNLESLILVIANPRQHIRFVELAPSARMKVCS